MFTITVGKSRMGRRSDGKRWCLQGWIVIILVLFLILIGMLLEISPFKASNSDSSVSSQTFVLSSQAKKSAGTCFVKKTCPEDQFSFFMRSGAANVVGPVICVQNNLVLGTVLNNAGSGINIVVLEGKTGEVKKTDHFDMYGGEVTPLITLLKNIQAGSVVLIATFDDPASKLNDEARKLITDLGSSSINLLGFRDNWLFVGGKGTATRSSFEKYMKNDQSTNKYENWPELIEMEGCIPKFLD